MRGFLIVTMLAMTGDIVFSFRPTIRWPGLAHRKFWTTPKPRNTAAHIHHERMTEPILRRRCDSTMSTSLSSNEDMTGWTIARTVKDSIQKLDDGNVTEPCLSVRHLLAASLELPWETGFRDLDHLSQQQRLTSVQAHDFAVKLERRLKHEPIQYILGQWDFLDYTIRIRPPLLCPRPETEELVENIVHETTKSSVHILDVGCGTGVIGLALAERLPDATVEAIDIEPVAIETSLENAERILGAKSPSRGSRYVATLVSAADFVAARPFDLVVSNPPYIPKADMATLSMDVLKYESQNALCGGEDGLDVVRTIIHQLPNWCRSGAICWMEVDPSHPTLIRDWLDENQNLDVQFVSTFYDMFGKARFVKVRVK
jgi:release factor glutamine methyltransferase